MAYSAIFRRRSAQYAALLRPTGSSFALTLFSS
jgi:hypothetical protein